MSTKGLCRCCLLSDMTGENNYYESVLRYRAAMPQRLRTPDDIYASRLKSCLACDYLDAGTCMQCGCYVEVRAARIDVHCPARTPAW